MKLFVKNEDDSVSEVEIPGISKMIENANQIKYQTDQLKHQTSQMENQVKDIRNEIDEILDSNPELKTKFLVIKKRVLKSKRKMQILKHLNGVGSDYNAKIALNFDVAPGSFVVHLQALEKYGFVEKFMKEDDAKTMYYKLTPLGKTVSENKNQ